MVTTSKGPVFTQAPASGIHEVLILSQDHDASWADLDDRQIGVVMSAVRDRMDAHAHSKVIRYSQVIVNWGRAAGASVEHPHGQLLGISFVPRELVDEQAGFSRFVGGCVLCATAELERTAGTRVIVEEEDALVVAPYWSSAPFEMLVIPASHGAHLHLSSPSGLAAAGSAIAKALRMLRERVGNVSYNLVFHSSPYRAFGNFHWHVHIVPKLTTTAGFELGTGVAINIVSPENAAMVLTGRDEGESAAAV
jgi:UDPglucose--hexose-1-phosphate uridylyltransferase